MRFTVRLLPQSLVGRVFALYTVVLVTFVVAGLAAFYRYQFTVVMEDSQLRAESLAAVLMPTVSDSAVIGDYDTIRRTLERAVHHSAFSSAAFIDLRGGKVLAPRNDKPEVDPPDWLLQAVARRLYDTNQTVAVGGRDYGVLRLSFAHDRIAGGLWQQTRIALELALMAVVAGLVLIRLPLVHWLGNLSRIKSFEQAIESGHATPALLAAQQAPSEFRDTFEVLGRAAANLQAQRAQTDVSLVALRKVLEDLSHDGDGQARLALAASDDLAAVSHMVQALVGKLQMRGEQLDAIFALSPDGFVSFDAQRRANYVSPAFTRLTGLHENRITGRTEAEIEALLRAQMKNGSSWRGLAALHDETPASGEAAPAPLREQIELVRPAQRVLDVGLRQGNTAAITQVLYLRDVTHESEVDQMKSEFLSTAAHELRTPMASIFGFVELMIHRTLSPERQRDVLETVHRQTKLMISIVNELLDLARIEARRGNDFVLEAVDLAGLVRSVLHDFKPPQEREAPALAVLNRALPVCIDLNKMRQALGNVLSNAYKYSPAGGPVQVRLLAGPAPAAGAAPTVGVEVRDSGIGMTAEQLARVSERFYRADASGNIPGTGLGMSIVKEIIELLGGRLTLASEPGQGTAVTLWLPLVCPAAEETHTAAAGVAQVCGVPVDVIETADTVRPIAVETA